MKKYYEVLKSLREDRDLKQKDVAKVLKMRQQQYSKYECGYVGIQIEKLCILADFYDVSLDYLAGRTDCEQGVQALHKMVTETKSVGSVVTDLLRFNQKERGMLVYLIEAMKRHAASFKK